jgi:hypothetical protein
MQMHYTADAKFVFVTIWAEKAFVTIASLNVMTGERLFQSEWRGQTVGIWQQMPAYGTVSVQNEDCLLVCVPRQSRTLGFLWNKGQGRKLVALSSNGRDLLKSTEELHPCDAIFISNGEILSS